MKKWLTLVAAMVVPVALAGCAAGLHQAAKKGDGAVLQKQLDAGADINESGTTINFSGSPLSHAAYYCHPEAVRYLLQKGADIEGVGGVLTQARRPLHWAVQQDCKEVVRLLLDAGADINAKAGWASHGTPLGIAAYYGHIQLTEYLIARGADIEVAIAGLNDSREGIKAKALLEEQRQKAVVEAARKAAQRQAEEKQEAIRKTLERADLVELLEMRPEKGLQIQALTQALIRAKNTQLPAFLVRSSVEERVDLLTAVELRIADAQALVARLNAQAEDAVRQGQSAAPLREEAGKVQTYAGILSAIRSLLLQS
ncbi:MAG: ankyrin repeat domain-containing protein [Desulfobacterales bacterium]|nr:ankyrin repeat domain-containing protein [Desulfobacterales bacterium]